MYGDEMGRLNVTANGKLVWTHYGDHGDTWINKLINIDLMENLTIEFIGIFGTGYECDIALDDIALTPGSCSGVNTDAQTCANLNRITNLETCPKEYLYTEDINLSFEPDKKMCSGYSDRITESFLHNCTTLNNKSSCELNLSEYVQRFPICFRLHDLLIQYKCEVEETTVPLLSTSEALSEETSTEPIASKVKKKSENLNYTGLVVGLVMGSLVLVLIVVVIAIFIRRFSSVKNKLEKVDRLQGNDYIGQQNIAMPQSLGPTEHLQYKDIQSERNNRNHGYVNAGTPIQNNDSQYNYSNITTTNSNVNKSVKDNDLTNVALQEDVPRAKYVMNDDEYAIVDPTAKTSIYLSKEDKTMATENYMVLDPNEMGFDRSNFSHKNQPYELAKPVSDKYTDDENDRYAVSQEGTYDYSGSNRLNELEDNIYNHAVDDVYDSGSLKRTNEGKDDTYDHFFGHTTEDDYDISRKT
ncbi:uncharacterized protein LOC127707512 [Mytilus californianus]|uniref:uncharacterized protein LOC127707512 n=1 Tax=Mytilus californianus TaxID=6549 RepID=UPI0022476EF4|nr:uncharacterized protein LOC127707512 [Mytilus californianus]